MFRHFFSGLPSTRIASATFRLLLVFACLVAIAPLVGGAAVLGQAQDVLVGIVTTHDGRPGDGARYQASPADAAALDQIVDSICMMRSPGS